MDQDCDINKVAGNTISVPVVGACAAVILGGTKMKADAAINRRDLKPVPPSSSSTLAAVWIGAQRVGSKSVPKFGLLAAAGKASKSKTKRCHDDDDDDEEGDAGAVPAPRSLKTLKRPAAKLVQAKLKFSSGPSGPG